MRRPRPPQVKARPWLHGDRVIPGIAFMRGQRVLAHMTAAQARNTADKLHDLADQLEAAVKPNGKPMAKAPAGHARAVRGKRKPQDSGDKSVLLPRTSPNSTSKRGNTAHKAGVSAHYPQPTLTAADGTEEPPLPATIAE